MNRVDLIGRITKDIELRYTHSNKAVTSFTIAVNKRDNGADFISCVAWGKTAENMGKYLGKGSKIAVSGRLQVRDYEKDGIKHYVTEVVADEVEFLDNKKSENHQSNTDFVEVDGNDDDLPF